jgi:hypothetical protein
MEVKYVAGPSIYKWKYLKGMNDKGKADASLISLEEQNLMLV